MPQLDRKQLANQPYAAAMRRARLLANLTLDEWAARLTEHGAPSTRDQANKWESGDTIVPAFALEGAKRAIGRAMGELLNVEGDPLQDRVASLEERIHTLEVLMARLRAAGVLPATGEDGQGEEVGSGTDT